MMRPEDSPDSDEFGFAPAPPAKTWQYNSLVALGVCSALVLIAGVVTFFATRGSDGDDGETTASVVSGVPATAPVSSSSTTSTTTTTTSTTTTTTTLSLVAIADAGDDISVSSGADVTLAALGLADGTPDDAVSWKQVAGPDVTEGSGVLSGSEPSFVAPPDVTTLRFELTVAGTDELATDQMAVRVFHDVDTAVFVDGESGSDDGAGTLDDPFRTIAAAAAAAGDGDIHLRSGGVYDATGATVALGASSLFGGFDAEWHRNPSDRATIRGAAVGIRISDADEVWLSAIDLTGADGADDRSTAAVSVTNVEVLHIDDCRIVAGDGGRAVDSPHGGSSLGLGLDDVGDVSVVRSTVNAGAGADGRPGAASGGPSASGANGDDGRDRAPGAGASGRGAGRTVAGGDGGRGGRESDGSAADGGGAGGTSSQPDGRPGDGGGAGRAGRGGDGGAGIVANPFGAPIGASGSPGSDGEPGSGGRGGGGGHGTEAEPEPEPDPDSEDDQESDVNTTGVDAVDGGGGGGGGAGGAGTDGGTGGGGGSSSIGVWAVDVDRLSIVESLIAASAAGDGGPGAASATAGNGGAGGRGAAPGRPDVEAGAGGGGGGGGAGGSGGQGGGGGGGLSIAIHTVRVDSVVIRSTTARAGRGGSGAVGGSGGQTGGNGVAGDGRNGGGGGQAGAGDRAAQGAGASGGSSIGWLDLSNADQQLDDAVFVPGPAGVGGAGSTQGRPGASLDQST